MNKQNRQNNKERGINMIRPNICAVIVDEVSCELVSLSLSGKLTELGPDGITELCELIARNNSAWESVLNGERMSMIFDIDTGDKICINLDRYKGAIL